MAKKQQDNIDMGLVAEHELSKLQRQYRIMEGDKFAYSGEASGKLKRQRNLIKILRKEQNNILLDLKIATSQSKKKEDTKVNNYLDELLHEYECLGENLAVEKAHLKELTSQVKKMEKEVAEIKPRTITDFQSQERILKGQRTVSKLENKLEVHIKKFNIVVAENYELRNEIDHLLKERGHFNLLWDKLIDCLNQGKKFMLDLIEQATLAYDQREEWCNKLHALRAKGQQDLLVHTKDMRFLQRKLDHDMKLQQFLGTKGQKRVLFDLEMRNKKHRKQARSNMQKQLEEYRIMLKKIQDFCKETDVEKLAAKYIKQEEENFALFNYINELSHETELLAFAIEDLKKKIDVQKTLNNQRATQQAENLVKFAQQLESIQKKADASTDQLEAYEYMLDIIYDGIDLMFETLYCDDTPVLELLGDAEEINQYNVTLFFTIIENKIIEYMQHVYYKEKTTIVPVKKGKPPLPRLIQPDKSTRYKQNPFDILVPTQPCALCVEQEQVSDVIDTLQFAQGPKEVIEKLAIRLELPHALDRLHNVSACHLPQSRKIIQQRYQ